MNTLYEALKQISTLPTEPARDIALKALREYEQQEKPEPVVLSEEWTACLKLPVIVHVRKQREGERHISTREGITPVKPDDLIMRGISGEEYPIGRDIWEKTYTTNLNNTQPPRRDWVGLTEEQREGMFSVFLLSENIATRSEYAAFVLGVRETESKLKELNHGH